MKRGWRFVVAVVLGVIGWAWLVIRLLPSLVRGKPVLPRDAPEPMPDPSSVEQRAEEAVEDATAQATQAKAPHLVAIEEARATVDAVPAARTKRKRRELLAKLADKADAP